MGLTLWEFVNIFLVGMNCTLLIVVWVYGWRIARLEEQMEVLWQLKEFDRRLEEQDRRMGVPTPLYGDLHPAAVKRQTD